MDEYAVLDFAKKTLAPIILQKFEQAGLTVSEAEAASYFLKEEIDSAVSRSAGSSIFRFQIPDE